VRKSKRGREKKRQQQQLRQQQREAGLSPHTSPSPSNRKAPFASIEAERTARQDAVCGLILLMRQLLPTLLGRLGKIPDPRNPKKLKHQLTVLLLYGILSFVFQYGSRRAANGEITRPMFEHNLRLLFPQLQSLPHSDTLFRLLARIEVQRIEQAHIELLQRLIRNKKFSRYRIHNGYPIAIDGTQKCAFSVLEDAHWLQRRTGHKVDPDSDEPQSYQYYVYVLEASFSFRNGLVIPLMSEFLDYQPGEEQARKQDCETKAFHRLAARLKKAFPRLPILLLLDGLYPNGPILQRCRTYHWDFMIVLKDGSLPSVWEEYDSLRHEQEENQMHQNWGERAQHFQWVNLIRYHFGPNAKHFLDLHVVVCRERWQALDPDTAEIVPKQSKHAWISSRPLSRLNVHARCNLAARYRWGIEGAFLVEKHHGYAYEHVFAKQWNAMKGYHYLMRLAHLINTLARFSTELAELFSALGVQAAIGFIRNTLTGPWLDPEPLEQQLNRPFRLRLV